MFIQLRVAMDSKRRLAAASDAFETSSAGSFLVVYTLWISGQPLPDFGLKPRVCCRLRGWGGHRSSESGLRRRLRLREMVPESQISPWHAEGWRWTGP